MHTLEQIIKDHYADKGESTMWESTKIISDAVEKSMPDEARERLKREIYALMCGGHFNESFAKETVSKMYYTEDGEKMYAPYWTESAVREMYDRVKDEIEPYNFWDFFVVIHMTASDNHALLMRWFPDEDSADREARYLELAVNWLRDDDNPFGKTKAWSYFNGSK